jgi:hypothetical protein
MLRITPIRTPERASDHLARVHRYGAEEPPVTAWFGAGAAAKGLSGPVDGAPPQAFVVGACQRTTPLSAPSSTLRMEEL